MDAAKVHEELQLIREDLALIKRAIVGEPKTGQEGLVKRVAKLERGYAGLLLKAAAVAGTMGGAATWVGKFFH